MRFEALQAEHGDCLLLTFSGPNRSYRLLVDGGPTRATTDTLKERLDQERQDLNLGRTDSLDIDAVMISHIDDDHVVGILNLFEELADLKERRMPWPWKPRWLLHNSFDEIVGEGIGGAARTVGGETVLASLGAEAFPFLAREFDEDALKILQSYKKGSDLAFKAAGLPVTRNPPDQQALAYNSDEPRVLRMGDARLRIIGPLKPQIDRLQEEWERWKATGAPRTSVSGFPAGLDASITNLSSIVALIEDGNRKILLTGDAQGPLIVQGLRAAGLLDNGPLHVDVLKLPHHGSERNITTDLLEAVTADHYVASGDGNFGNPDKGTLTLLAEMAPRRFTLHLTYPPDECDERHKEYLKAHHKTFRKAVHAIAPVIESWQTDSPHITVSTGTVAIDLP